MEIIFMHCCSLLIASNDFLRASREATDGKDSYATLALGNWNYYDALRSEKRGPKLEATHLEKANELYTKVQSIARIRGALSRATHTFFQNHDFIEVLCREIE
ncbi:hypothetical protein Scep_015375 [Stephania cephalantha]|uniref:Uncharacterized protein n=1 Tax=Stephania cephalantha TaxID=152367 RepID=A0AAP0J333_9MAGN